MQTVPQTQETKPATPKADAPKAKPLTFVAPAVDVYESDTAILVVTDIPGVKSGDLDIELDKDTLTFVGKRAEAGIAYKRSFTVPREIDPEAIRAELKDGVLKLELGKHASRRARTIAVKTA